MMRSHWLGGGLLLVCVRDLAAQPSYQSLASYEVSVPIGDTRRFLTRASWFGISWEGRWAVANRTVAGAFLGFNEFSERFEGTTNFPSGAATGPQFRYLLSTPVLATGYVYPVINERVRWYLGGGAGGVHVSQWYALGTRQFSNGEWHFMLVPEVGAEIPIMGGAFHGAVSLRYNAPIAAGDYVGGGSRSFRYVTLRFALIE
jgi:hypothetical protein